MIIHYRRAQTAARPFILAATRPHLHGEPNLHRSVLSASEPMVAQGGGRIVFISSGAGVDLCKLKLNEGGWGMLYAAGKGAFSKLAEFVDLEYRERGVSSFHIQPGLTITEALLAQYGDAATGFGGGQPCYTPQDTGRTVAWMLDADEAPRFAGPEIRFAPTFFSDNKLTLA